MSESHPLSVTFHGVRGSIPCPGPATARVGGNTSCVEVRAGSTRIVLDAGSGIRALGDHIAAGPPSTTYILLSHVHWDHIHGLPFFAPLYIPGHHIQIMSPPNGKAELETVLRAQMSAPFFPVAFDDVRPQTSLVDLQSNEHLRIDDVSISVARLNHPDPVYAYRLDAHGKSVVYATDTEHYSVIDPTLMKLCSNADVLIYDAMYTPSEYPRRVGWGHSTYEAGIALARAADVGSLILFHHDPNRSDDEVDAIERSARALFKNSHAAREGMTIRLGVSRSDHEQPEIAGAAA